MLSEKVLGISSINLFT